MTNRLQYVHVLQTWLLIISSFINCCKSHNNIFASNQHLPVRCKIQEIAYLPEQRHGTIRSNSIYCIEEKENIYIAVDGDIDGFFERKEKEYKRYETFFLHIPSTFILDEDRIHLDREESSKIEIEEMFELSSRYGNRIGTWKVLVLRVGDINGDFPSKSAAEIASDIFFDAVNMSSLAKGCSGNKLNFVPATGDAVNQGVIDITLPQTINSYWILGDNSLGVAKAAVEMIPTDGSVDSDYTYTMVVEPQSANFHGAGAAAARPGTMSWFKNLFASDPLYSWHEISHNLGNGHSGMIVDGVFDDEMDPTCIMGGADVYNDVSSGQDDFGRICFNAAKTYYNGWFNDYTYDVAPSTNSFQGDLVGTNDALNKQIQSEQNVVLRLKETGETSLFMMYQRVEGVTIDIDPVYSMDFGNHVVIVEQEGDGYESIVKASIAEEEIYTQIWNGERLIVKVCSIRLGSPDVARIAAYVRGRTSESCPNEECVDDDSYQFILENGNIQDCSWFTKSPTNTERRIEKYCFTGTSASTIGYKCLKSCGLCEASASAPTAVPVSQPSTLNPSPNVSSSQPSSTPTWMPSLYPTISLHPTIVTVTPSPTASSLSPTTIENPEVPTTPKTKQCINTNLAFRLGPKYYKCRYLRTDTKRKCKEYRSFQRNCPKTCKRCRLWKCKDSNSSFRLKNGAVKTCEWAASNPSRNCSIRGVKKTCRKTCNYCDVGDLE